MVSAVAKSAVRMVRVLIVRSLFDGPGKFLAVQAEGKIRAVDADDF